jgi:hypothetical protein
MISTGPALGRAGGGSVANRGIAITAAKAAALCKIMGDKSPGALLYYDAVTTILVAFFLSDSI